MHHIKIMDLNKIENKVNDTKNENTNLEKGAIPLNIENDTLHKEKGDNLKISEENYLNNNLFENDDSFNKDIKQNLEDKKFQHYNYLDLNTEKNDLSDTMKNEYYDCEKNNILADLMKKNVTSDDKGNKALLNELKNKNLSGTADKENDVSLNNIYNTNDFFQNKLNENYFKQYSFNKENQSIQLGKTIPRHVYEYNHNVIYHELYVELLHVNKNLQNEIKTLKKIIEMQKILIKSKEITDDHIDEKKKINNKKFVNNNYFLNFFNKKKKKNKDFTTSKEPDIYLNKKSYIECEKIYDNEDNFKTNLKKMDEKIENEENKYIKLPLSENEYSELFNYNSPTNVDNSVFEKKEELYQNKRESNILEEIDQQNAKYEGSYEKEEESNNINKNEEISTLIYWYEEILPMIKNKKKKKLLISCMINNYMPKKIKEYFWEMSINNKLNLAEYFVQILIKNTTFTQFYVYTNNKQYYNHASRYFKSLKISGDNNLNLNVVETELNDKCNIEKNTSDYMNDENNSIIDKNNNNNENGDETSNKNNNKLNNDGNNNIESNTYESNVDENNNKKSNSKNNNTKITINENNNENNSNKDEHISNSTISLFENFSIEKYFYQILIDLDRTIYIIKKNQEYFKKYHIGVDNFILNVNLSDVKKKLNTLLQMYVLFKPELGYVQGMSYIALVFLLYCDLETAFVHFANFMDKKDIYNLYSFNKEEIKIFVYTIKEILLKRNIEIYKEIIKHYNIDNIFIQWIFTIFFICLPFHIFIRIFDIYTIYDRIIYEIILCIFTYLDKFYHFQNVDVAVKNLSTFSFNINIQEDKFWDLLKTIKIKKRKILHYRKKYFDKINSEVY